jgi:hypothetical protein
MTKSTVTKIFVGSLTAITGGVVLLAAGVLLAYANGSRAGAKGELVTALLPDTFNSPERLGGCSGPPLLPRDRAARSGRARLVVPRSRPRSAAPSRFDTMST